MCFVDAVSDFVGFTGNPGNLTRFFMHARINRQENVKIFCHQVKLLFILTLINIFSAWAFLRQALESPLE